MPRKLFTVGLPVLSLCGRAEAFFFRPTNNLKKRQGAPLSKGNWNKKKLDLTLFLRGGKLKI